MLSNEKSQVINIFSKENTKFPLLCFTSRTLILIYKGIYFDFSTQFSKKGEEL